MIKAALHLTSKNRDLRHSLNLRELAQELRLAGGRKWEVEEVGLRQNWLAVSGANLNGATHIMMRVTFEAIEDSQNSGTRNTEQFTIYAVTGTGYVVQARETNVDEWVFRHCGRGGNEFSLRILHPHVVASRLLQGPIDEDEIIRLQRVQVPR